MNVGILYHAGKPQTVEMAKTVYQWLVTQGATAWIAAHEQDLAQIEERTLTRLLIVLGGDGSTLHAARISAPYQIPVFCINMGRIGFLSEAEVHNWQERLSKVLQGDYWTERRLMLQAQVLHNQQLSAPMVALNDIVVGRGTHARMVRLTLYVDNDHVTSYAADGLIVATPTGSTAYSMAAGGPLLPPELENFLVMPVAAHLSLNRALVLHRQAVIRIQVEMDHDAIVTADGQESRHLQSGDEVILQKNRHVALFVRVDRSGYFYQRLMRRLGVQVGGN